MFPLAFTAVSVGSIFSCHTVLVCCDASYCRSKPGISRPVERKIRRTAVEEGKSPFQFLDDTLLFWVLLQLYPCLDSATVPAPPQLTSTTEDSVIEPHNLSNAEAESEVNSVPSCKGVLARRYAVSNCCVVITKLHGCATQRTDDGCICCNDVFCVPAFIVRSGQ
jgi:hypothetical protein